MASPGDPALIGCLRDLIRTGGSVTFERFMEACLYAPDRGYYSKSSMEPGRTGDFYTSVSTGNVFGRLLADHLVHLWGRHFSSEPLTILEQGAHGGRMALDILDVLQKQYPDCYQTCRYICIEPRPGLRQRQEKTLANHPGKTCCHESLQNAGLGKIPVFFLSNELVDSFPVRWICRTEGIWQECLIAWEEQGQRFVKEFIPVEDSGLLEEIIRWKIPELEDYRAEVCLQSGEWMRDLAGGLHSGFILTVDYGFTAAELYAPSRPQGTLSCYSGHRRDGNPLVGVGEKDITAHVNFSLLMEEGAKAGWQTLSFKDQHHALIEIAQGGFLQELEENMARDPRDKEAQAAIRQFQTLTHPGIMGAQFKFLLQAKGV